MDDTKSLRIQEVTISTGEIYNSEIFGKQKVKLYKIKHIIFDFGGIIVDRSFALKNLLDTIEIGL